MSGCFKTVGAALRDSCAYPTIISMKCSGQTARGTASRLTGASIWKLFFLNMPRVSRKGMTVKKLYEEYSSIHPDGYRHSAFGTILRLYMLKSRTAVD